VKDKREGGKTFSLERGRVWYGEEAVRGRGGRLLLTLRKEGIGIVKRLYTIGGQLNEKGGHQSVDWKMK